MSNSYSSDQLKAEIEAGPLAADLAPFWGGVFPEEPEPTEFDPATAAPDATPEDIQRMTDRALAAIARWHRVRYRFGRLTPDAAYGLLEMLNNPTKDSRPQPITVPAFTAFLAARGLLRRIKAALAADTLPGQILDACDLITTIIQSSPERTIDPAAQTTTNMIAALQAGSLIDDNDLTAFLAACAKPCSRLQKLGWAVGIEDLQAAKEVV